ncbi:MAG: VOC family protein, partial [Candidatus Staskawiczbacteria bacterium]|nr:VOC family protein [Candidatus Staskawiczbacteria bacterium]
FIDSISGLKNVGVRTIKMSADDGNLIELLCYKSHLKQAGARKDICEIGPSHVAFTIEDIDFEYEKLKKEGIKFNCPPKISVDGSVKVTFCRDPDGTLIELVQEIK